MTTPTDPPVDPSVDPPAQADPPAEPDWKALSRKHEDRAKAMQKKADENAAAAKELADLKASTGSEQEKAVAAARTEATTEAATRYKARIVTSEIKAAAGGKLADPADAVRLLDLTTFELDDNDELDAAQVLAAIDGLLKAKPYLAAKEAPRAPGSADQGARITSKQTPAESIAEAEAKGDWKLAGQLKAQQLAALPKT